VYAKLLHGAGRLLSRGAAQAKKIHKIIHKTISKKLKKTKSFEKILATAEGLEVRIAGESMMFFEGEAEKAGMALGKGAAAEKTAGTFAKQFALLDESIGNLAHLEQAAEAIKDIPGALDNNGPLTKLLDCGKKGSDTGKLAVARGAAYEVEAAYNLIQKGEEVIGLGEHIQYGSTSREFDIITKNKLIECKNINWAKNVRDPNNSMPIRFGAQAKIAKGHGKIFEIHSKQAIPDEWKHWFREKNITFIEG
jgi:hypothetical protein